MTFYDYDIAMTCYDYDVALASKIAMRLPASADLDLAEGSPPSRNLVKLALNAKTQTVFQHKCQSYQLSGSYPFVSLCYFVFMIETSQNM